MRQQLLFAFISLLSSAGFACEDEGAMQLAAVRTVYADADIARYVCIDISECSIEEFFRQVEIKAVTLDAAGTPAIQIEPRRKGTQYFSAIFLQEQCKYTMVFAPDTTLSSVKLLKTKKNNYYILRAVEHESTDSWKEYDFSYDLASRQYSKPTAHCFKARGDKIARVTCEQ